MYLTCSLPTRKYLLFHKAKCGASSYNLNFVYTRLNLNTVRYYI